MLYVEGQNNIVRMNEEVGQGYGVITNVGLLKASELDNVKKYDSPSKTAEIIDKFGFGKTIASIKLNTQQDVMVIPGKDRQVAEIEIDLKEETYNAPISKIVLKDLKANKELTGRNVNLKQKILTGYKNVEKYEQECTNRESPYSKELTLVCEPKLIGMEKVETYEWMPFNKTGDIIKGKIIIGIFADVKAGDKIDWIPTMFGEDITEWATWSDGLNSNLVVAYNMNEGNSGAAASILNSINQSRNITTTNSPTYVANGKIGNGTQWVSASSQYGYINNYNFSGSGNYSVSIWVNMTSGANGQFLWAGGDSSGTGKGFGLGFDFSNDDKYWIFGQSADVIAPSSTTLNVWHHIVVIQEDNKRRMYIDGVNVANGTNTYNIASKPVWVGQSPWGSGRPGAVMDAFYIWEGRVLSSSEISDLYNSGTAIEYTATGSEQSSSITVTLNSPANTVIVTNGSQLYNTTITSVNTNITNATFYLWNSTNNLISTANYTFSATTSISLQTQFNFTKRDTYYWNYEARGVNNTGTLNVIASSNYSLIYNNLSWYDTDYNECYNLSVFGGQESLTWFEAYINLNSSHFGTNINTTSWGNLRFVNQSCNNFGSVMPYEIDVKNTTSAGFWIGNPLSTGINNWSIYISSNKSINANENSSAVWKNWKYVYHFSESTGNMTKESSILGNNATTARHNNATNGNWTIGQIGNAIRFNGDTSFMESLENQSSELTGNGDRAILVFAQVYGNGKAADLHEELGGLGWASSNGRYYLRAENSGSWRLIGNAMGNDYDTTVPYTTNYNMHYAQHVSGVSKWWVNTTQSLGSFSHSYATLSAPIGLGGAVYYPFATPIASLNGSLDEFRIANTSFSSAYVNRTYQILNYSNVNVGPVESYSGSPTDQQSINITLNLPTNGTTIGNSYYTFNFTVEPINVNISSIEILFRATPSGSYTSYPVTIISNNSTANYVFVAGPFSDAQTFYWNARASSTESGITEYAASDYIGYTDLSTPIITINYPLSTNYNITNLSLNYSITGSTLSSCWYYNGSANNSITCGSNVSSIIANQGSNTWIVYANNSAGNVFSSSVTFNVDSVNPDIAYQIPFTCGSKCNPNGVLINYTDIKISLGTYDLNSYTTNIYLYNSDLSLNNTYSESKGGGLFTIANTYSLTDGVYYYNATITDSYGNTNYTATRTFTILTLPVTISLVSPIENINYLKVGDNLNFSFQAISSNLSSCWYNYSGIVYYSSCTSNIPVNGSINLTSNKSITFYANTTSNLISSLTIDFPIYIFEISSYYLNNTYETSKDYFSINYTTKDIVSTIAYLYYNGTPYASNINCTGHNCLAWNNVSIPIINGAQRNISFNWLITVYNGSSSITSNSTIFNHSVLTLTLGNCTTGSLALNFTGYNEQTRARLYPLSFEGSFNYYLGDSSVYKTYNLTQQSGNEVDICINTNRTMYTDAIIAFYSDAIDAPIRNWFYQGHTINSTMQVIKMYVLDTENSTSFILQVQDRNVQPMKNVLVNAQRCYLGVDSNETVFIHRTDSNGLTVGNFKAETALYQFFITNYSQTLLAVTPCAKVIPQTAPYTLLFQLGETYESPFTDIGHSSGASSRIYRNKSTNIVTWTYTDTSDNFTGAQLVILNLNSTGSEEPIVCSSSSNISSGILSCNITEGNTYAIQGFIYRIGQTIRDQTIEAVQSFYQVGGYAAAFLGFFLILVSAFAFKFDEKAGIWLVFVACFISNYFGLIGFGYVWITAQFFLSLIITAVLDR